MGNTQTKTIYVAKISYEMSTLVINQRNELVGFNCSEDQFQIYLFVYL